MIERPASVVKELLENSVDAGATRIDIDLEQGGTDLIRVVDDGCGIDPTTCRSPSPATPPASSADADDLFRIGTLGFRGEALASIGGVAKVTLQSRAAGPGRRRRGAVRRRDAVARSARGTARPARASRSGTCSSTRRSARSSCRPSATEMGHVVEAVTRLALANPGTAPRPAAQRPAGLRGPRRRPAARTASACSSAGRSADALIDLSAEQGRSTLAGFVADPACDRGNAKLQYLFVNGRWVRDRSLGHALQEAYRGLLMTGRYAVGFLFLQLPPDQVDVNVHPTKAEVRFRDSQALYHLVRACVKRALRAKNLVPRLQAPAGPGAAGPPPRNDVPAGRTCSRRRGRRSPSRGSLPR